MRDSVVFDDPVTQAVIQQSFGGWAKLCQESLVNEEKWRRKEFARAYAAYARQGVSLHLPTSANTARTIRAGMWRLCGCGRNCTGHDGGGCEA